jgi:nitroreductase
MTSAGPALPPVQSYFSDAEVGQLLRTVQAAPSLDNSQPWRVTVFADQIEVCTDPYLEVPVADPVGRQRVISTGAALLNLRLALRMLGRQAAVRLFPDPSRPGLVAVVTARPGPPPSAEEQLLYRAVTQRRTWRAPFSSRLLPEGAVAQLADDAAREGAMLLSVTSHADRDRLADLLVAAVAGQLANPGRAAEQLAWLRTGPAEDGIPVGNLVEATYPIPGLPTAGTGAGQENWQPGVRGLAYRDTLLLLATRTDDPGDWVLAGAALQRVLLTATRFGFATGFLNQPLEAEPLRRALTESLGVTGCPQLLLRLGYPATPPPPPTPRRRIVRRTRTGS